MRGLVLAGGLGTRLRPLTHTGAKQLIPVANKPVIEYGIADLVGAGITDIGIIVGYTPERIRSVTETLGDGTRFGCRITYIEQDAPRGLAHAVATAREFLGDDEFVVYLGDNILKNGIRKYVETFRAADARAGVLLCHVEDPTIYGVASLAPDGRILDVEEKPKRPKTDLAIVGVYYFRPGVFDVIDRLKPSARGELELTDALRILIDEASVMGAVVDGWWDDTGTPGAILNANRLVLSDLSGAEIRGAVEKGAKVQGVVHLAKGAKIRDGARVKGPAVIGAGSTIGKDAYVGPYTSIGERCIVEATEIEDSVVMGDCVLKGAGRVVESLIGAHTRIEGRQGAGPRGARYILGEHSAVNPGE